MELFTLKPSVHLIDTFAEFYEAFGLGAGDLILTESLMYEAYIEPMVTGKSPLSSQDGRVFSDGGFSAVLKDKYDTAEPKEETIDAILLDMKKLGIIKRIIAVGGGSVIDIAKLLAVKDAYPIVRVMNKEVPRVYDKELILLPTTCGTGSEVTFGGIVTMKDTGYKTGIMDPTLSANHAVLVPELLSSLPLRVFMHCSCDALGHSMESYVSATRGNELARAAGARSISVILDNFAELVLCPEDERAELQKSLSGKALMASTLGGMAVNNGGAGPVHALAYPLGEIYHMSHGESIYQFLTPVFRLYERKKGGALIEELKGLIRPALKKTGLDTGDTFSDLEKLLNAVYPARRLSEAGMKEGDIKPFTESIFESKQRLLAASYSEFTKEDAEAIYRERL